MELAVRWIVIFGMAASGRLAMGADASGAPAPSADQIQQWVAALESDSYSARHAATERLILAGQPAVEPITQAIEQGGLETIIRGIYILRQLALSTSNVKTEAEAYGALQQISRRPITTAARRAATAIQALDEVRYRRAEQHLEQLGTVLSMTNVQVGPRLSQPFPSILIDESWRGSIEDLEWLSRITDARLPEGPEVWMISLRGRRVTDAWLQRISSLKNIRVVQLKSTGISDEALAHLKELPELRYLEVLYTSVTDAAVPYLASLKTASRMKLYGTQVSPEALQKLRGQLAGVEIDYRQGGFLGIGCEDNPCRITTVREGTAAAAANLQMGDIVTRYNDQPVKTMDELTSLIAGNAAGDQVQIEILRGGERLEKQVILGEWD